MIEPLRGHHPSLGSIVRFYNTLPIVRTQEILRRTLFIAMPARPITEHPVHSQTR